ncbi:MAG: EAL domain-containing protein [Vitreimonas sp.]
MKLLSSLVHFLLRHRILAGAMALLVAVSALDLVRPIDAMLDAARARVVQREPSRAIAIVEIDSRSLVAAPQWPWPRSRYAQAIRNLRAAGADLIGFDVDFSASSSDGEDAALQGAIDAAPGSVILPAFVQRGGAHQNRPLASLLDNALVASVNVPIDGDGKVRRYDRGQVFQGGFTPSMAPTLAGRAYGQTSPFLIDYGIRAEAIPHISFEDVVTNHFDRQLVAGRAVLIGSTALELGDEFATPIAPSMPGVYLHALAFESLHQGRALAQTSRLVTLPLALAALLVLWPRRQRLRRRDAVVRQLAVLGVAIGGPVLLQTLAPLSCEFAIILAAQGLAVWASVQSELDLRAAALLHQLQRAALHDPETELRNRRAMLQDLERRLKVNDQGVAALAIGIDQFSSVRGAIGYSKANEVVRSLAERLSQRWPKASIFHLSTSILGVVFDEPLDALDALCERLLVDLDTELNVGDHKIGVALRVGAANGASTAERLLEEASVALDHARLRNRRFLCFDASFPDPREKLALLADMRKGIERGEFYLVYQSKVHARDHDVIGAEALMRWRHPVVGDIAPDNFIRMAEETGAIDALTDWLLNRAIQDQKRMRAAGLNLPISVNISGATLGDVGFCGRAIAAVRASGADICFEITETAVIADPDAALATIATARHSGIRISIDDYGVGLSSLAYLKQIAADELKIDKSLIADIGRNARDRLIVKSTIDLAHSLGMHVIAEGVENAATQALLAIMGCDCVQGYLHGRPQPLEGFIAAHTNEFARASRDIATR